MTALLKAYEALERAVREHEFGYEHGTYLWDRWGCRESQAAIDEALAAIDAARAEEAKHCDGSACMSVICVCSCGDCMRSEEVAQPREADENPPSECYCGYDYTCMLHHAAAQPRAAEPVNCADCGHADHQHAAYADGTGVCGDPGNGSGCDCEWDGRAA
jgi:hypothetical protein